MRMQEEKKRVLLLVAAVAMVLVIVVGLGRVEFHNELERDRKEHAFLGYLDETVYRGTVLVEAGQYPAWYQKLEAAHPQTVTFAEQTAGRIGLFADVIYCENRCELRTWFSGRLLKRDAEYYWKLESPVSLEPVYEPLKAAIDTAQLKAADYDYMAFQGHEK